MTQSSGQVRVAGTGELFLAPVGTALPDTAAEALDAAFVGFGLTTEDGVSLSKSITREGIMAWQSVTPVRYINTGQEFGVAATFLQSSSAILKAWLGSGDFATDGGTGFRADVPVDPTTDQYALVLQWDDGDIRSRLTIAKTEITETGDVPIGRTATAFGLTFSALTPDSGTVLASWLTTDPAFDPTP